ncbi:MAG: hypothetical protein GBAus27B_000323 [Mycoplasmataceae bacterium]|nr:MAG: hypothetical protein GBAus27B_000323 [Mycoplasmataceae bacterium]
MKEVNGREEFTGKRIEIEISGKEVKEIEERWSKEGRLDLSGTYLLALVHDLIGYNLDDYRPNEDGSYNREVFARLDSTGLDIDKTGKGVVSVLPGGGKTTKSVSCVVNGGKTNVNLICPNEALAADGYTHHTNPNFLQNKNYKCVNHGISHGVYDVKLGDLTYWEDRTDPDKPKKFGKKGLSILQAEEFVGYVIRERVNPEELQEPTEKTIKKFKEEGKYNENFDEAKKEIKTKLVSKEDTINMFDEAHLNTDAKYRDAFVKALKGTM